MMHDDYCVDVQNHDTQLSHDFKFQVSIMTRMESFVTCRISRPIGIQKWSSRSSQENWKTIARWCARNLFLQNFHMVPHIRASSRPANHHIPAVSGACDMLMLLLTSSWCFIISFVRSPICQPLDGHNCHSFARVVGDPKRLHLEVIQLLQDMQRRNTCFWQKTMGFAIFCLKCL